MRLFGIESFAERGGPGGQLRRERGLLGRVEDLEDLAPALPCARVRRLGERHGAAIEPVDERAVLVLQSSQMTHGAMAPSRWTLLVRPFAVAFRRPSRATRAHSPNERC